MVIAVRLDAIINIQKAVGLVSIGFLQIQRSVEGFSCKVKRLGAKRVCSKHCISGKKSNDPLSPDYAPSVFSFVL